MHSFVWDVSVKGEAEGIEEDNILRESGMDEGAEYFCNRCKKRI